MVNTRKLQKNGNSLALNIPKFIIEQLGLKKGDVLNLDYIDRRDGSTPFIKLWKPANSDPNAEKEKTIPEPPGPRSRSRQRLKNTKA